MLHQIMTPLSSAFTPTEAVSPTASTYTLKAKTIATAAIREVAQSTALPRDLFGIIQTYHPPFSAAVKTATTEEELLTVVEDYRYQHVTKLDLRGNNFLQESTLIDILKR